MFTFAKQSMTPGPRVIFTVPSLVRCRIYRPTDAPMLDRMVAFDYRFLPSELQGSYPELFEEKRRAELFDFVSNSSPQCVVAASSVDPQVFFEGAEPGQLSRLVTESAARQTSMDELLLCRPATLVCRPIRTSLKEAGKPNASRLGGDAFLCLVAIKVDIRGAEFLSFDDFLNIEERQLHEYEDRGADL